MSIHRPLRVLWSCAPAVLAITMLGTVGCGGPSTEDLAKEVRGLIKEKFAKDPSTAGIALGDLTLVSRGGNDYRGILEVSAEGESAELVVEVSYDGETLIWEIKE